MKFLEKPPRINEIPIFRSNWHGNNLRQVDYILEASNGIDSNRLTSSIDVKISIYWSLNNMIFQLNIWN